MTNPSLTAAPPWHALVLAAGAGTRMGGDKLRRAWRGRPLLAWALEAAYAAPVSGVTLVLGGGGEGLRELAVEAAAGRTLGAIEAVDWAQGMSRSLAMGLAATPPEAAGAFVFLGDMPRVPHDVAARLAAALTPGRLAAAPVFDGRRGHPVLLTRGLFAAAMAGEGDRGAGALLAGLGERLALVPTEDDGVLYDVDTPAMLER